MKKILLFCLFGSLAHGQGLDLSARTDYESVGVSQTQQTLGPNGATGDILQRVVIHPGTTSPGAVVIHDGASPMTVFTGGASSVLQLQPFTVEVGARSKFGPWRITTGANVSVLAVGRFR